MTLHQLAAASSSISREQELGGSGNDMAYTNFLTPNTAPINVLAQDADKLKKICTQKNVPSLVALAMEEPTQPAFLGGFEKAVKWTCPAAKDHVCFGNTMDASSSYLAPTLPCDRCDEELADMTLHQLAAASSSISREQDLGGSGNSMVYPNLLTQNTAQINVLAQDGLRKTSFQKEDPSSVALAMYQPTRPAFLAALDMTCPTTQDGVFEIACTNDSEQMMDESSIYVAPTSPCGCDDEELADMTLHQLAASFQSLGEATTPEQFIDNMLRKTAIRRWDYTEFHEWAEAPPGPENAGRSENTKLVHQKLQSSTARQLLAIWQMGDEVDMIMNVKAVIVGSLSPQQQSVTVSHEWCLKTDPRVIVKADAVTGGGDVQFKIRIGESVLRAQLTSGELVFDDGCIWITKASATGLLRQEIQKLVQAFQEKGLGDVVFMDSSSLGEREHLSLVQLVVVLKKELLLLKGLPQLKLAPEELQLRDALLQIIKNKSDSCSIEDIKHNSGIQAAWAGLRRKDSQYLSCISKEPIAGRRDLDFVQESYSPMDSLEWIGRRLGAEVAVVKSGDDLFIHQKQDDESLLRVRRSRHGRFCKPIEKVEECLYCCEAVADVGPLVRLLPCRCVRICRGCATRVLDADSGGLSECQICFTSPVLAFHLGKFKRPMPGSLVSVDLTEEVDYS